MFYIVNKYLLRRRFVGVTLWPFVVMRDPELRDDKVFLNHENIHLRQQAELLVLPFFIWYLIEYLFRSRLVVVDLSFHNPNVFYELALRHAARLPAVQIIRKGERIPFDINQNRTIQIDCGGLHEFVPQIEAYRSQIASQARRAMEDADAADNPLTIFWPSLKVEI